jgi:hypothetical protein
MSIFSLKTNPDQLSSANDGVSDYKFLEVQPTRDVTGNSFPNGLFRMEWENSGTQWWIPSRSYLRMRCQLAHGDGSQLNVSDQVAPNLNLAANLFQSMELQINGKTISKCSDHVGEVDTLEQRLHKSKSWTDSVGASINWLQESLEDRISQVSLDGTVSGRDFVSKSTNPLLAIDSTTKMFVSPADDALTWLIFQRPLNYGQLDADRWNSVIKIGDIIRLIDNTEFTIKGTMFYNSGSQVLQIAVETSTGANRFKTPVTPPLFNIYRPKAARRVKQFEIIWRPMCLSIFKYGGALPTGKYSLILTPYNASGNNYQIRAVEIPKSVAVSNIPVFGSSVSNISFHVLDTRFYRATIEGERVDDITYYLDLEDTNYQSQNLQITTSLTKQYFDVPPLTHALTVCYQNRNAGIDLRQSSSRFVCNGYDSKTNEFTGVVNNELTLQRIFVTYGGRSYPQPDGDPSYIVGSAADYTTQRYIETITNSGGLFSEGGTESIQEWQARGAYHHISTPKDGSDRSTRVVVNQQFSSDFANQANIVLFAHSKSTAMISIVRSLVVDVQVLQS